MATTKRLFRRSSSGRLGGVCAGLAEYLDTDVTLVRLLALVLAVFPGGFVGGFLGYLAAWILMPDVEGPAPSGAHRLTRAIADRRLGGVCGGLAGYFNIDATVVRVAWAVLTIVPGGVVLGVFAYLVAWFIMPLEDVSHEAPAPVMV